MRRGVIPKKELQETLDYRFRNDAILDQALTHRSVSTDNNNERLEFLGDALLGAVISNELFSRFSDLSEGELTRLRSSLVKRESLARLARNLKLGEKIRLGEGERKSGGWRRDSILSNTLEAVIGAIYLDSDFATCSKVINRLYGSILCEAGIESIHKDPKTALQEFLQAKNLPLPIYRIVDEQGQAHERIFTIECGVAIMGRTVIATGKSKRRAEQAAANKMMTLIAQENSE